MDGNKICVVEYFCPLTVLSYINLLTNLIIGMGQGVIRLVNGSFDRSMGHSMGGSMGHGSQI